MCGDSVCVVQRWDGTNQRIDKLEERMRKMEATQKATAALAAAAKKPAPKPPQAKQEVKVVDHTKAIKAVKKDLTTLEGTIQALEGTVLSLQGRVETLEAGQETVRTTMLGWSTHLPERIEVLTKQYIPAQGGTPAGDKRMEDLTASVKTQELINRMTTNMNDCKEEVKGCRTMVDQTKEQLKILETKTIPELQQESVAAVKKAKKKASEANDARETEVAALKKNLKQTKTTLAEVSAEVKSTREVLGLRLEVQEKLTERMEALEQMVKDSAKPHTAGSSRSSHKRRRRSATPDSDAYYTDYDRDLRSPPSRRSVRRRPSHSGTDHRSRNAAGNDGVDASAASIQSLIQNEMAAMYARTAMGAGPLPTHHTMPPPAPPGGVTVRPSAQDFIFTAGTSQAPRE